MFAPAGIEMSEEQLAAIAGKRSGLLSSIQSIYGLTRAQAEREIRVFEARNKDYRPNSQFTLTRTARTQDVRRFAGR